MIARTHDGLRAGLGSFVFDDADSHRRLPVFYYAPPDLSEDSCVLFVMHGVKRNAKQYRDSWLVHAQHHRAMLVAPQFSEKCFPGCEGYNMGGITAGNPGQDTKQQSAFAILERLFDHIRIVTGIRTEGYLIYGHSAGAQFVHRLILLHQTNRAQVAIAANAGWYTLPTYSEDFPYGIARSSCTYDRLRSAFKQRLVILLGEGDTARSDRHLRSTLEALRQGRNRLERGHTKIRVAQEMAAEIGSSLHWKMRVLPGIGHSNRGIVPTASEILFASN